MPSDFDEIMKPDHFAGPVGNCEGCQFNRNYLCWLFSTPDNNTPMKSHIAYDQRCFGKRKVLENEMD